MATKTKSKKSTAKSSSKMQSFRVARDTQPFMSMRFTRQTVYWTILLIFIVLMQLWLLKIQLDVIHLTESINVNAL